MRKNMGTSAFDRVTMIIGGFLHFQGGIIAPDVAGTYSCRSIAVRTYGENRRTTVKILRGLGA